MIPVEAVEAAAQGLALQAWGDWEYVPDELRLLFLRDAQIALEAAAPHMRRTVTTIEELDALPSGSVILDSVGLSLHKSEFTGWRASNGAKNVTIEMLEQEALPAIVLHEPTP